LQSLRGIGPAMAARILAERSRAPFRSLADFDERVKGIGPASLRRLVADGLVLATPAAGSGLLQAGAVATRGPGRPMVQQFQGGGVVPAPHGRVLGPP
jgi:competence protein ComEA